MKPLISLVMILKNEEASIEKTLISCAPYLDRYSIWIDSKSTDRTRQILADGLDPSQGQIVTGTFKNFSQARNEALDAETEATFALMLSGCETLVNGEALVKFCQEHVDDTDGGYDVDVQLNATTFRSTRLTRVASKWRYVGAVHELALGPNEEIATKHVPDVCVLHTKDSVSIERDLARWRRDVDLLLAEWARESKPRTAFYLAQTYDCLGERDNALEWYERRIALGGWWEEIFEAKMRRARLLGNTVDELLKVYDYASHRAEPLYEIGLHYYRQGEYAAALLFAEKAAALPYPKADRLFVTESYYRWQAWDLVACCAKDDPKLAYEAAQKALAGNPTDERLQRNLKASLERYDSVTRRAS